MNPSAQPEADAACMRQVSVSSSNLPKRTRQPGRLSSTSGHSAVRYSGYMNTNADDLIGEINAASISPMTHAVTRGLYRHIPLRDALQNEIVAAFDDCRKSLDMAAFQVALWSKINSLEADDEGGLRLLVALTRPDEVIDWYIAEFMILWARQQGVSECQIIDAFHE